MSKRVIRIGDSRQIVVQLPDGTTKLGQVDGVGRVWIDIEDPAGQQGGGNGVGGQESFRNDPQRVGDLKPIPKDISFLSKLKSVLKDNSFHRVTHNLRRGKIDMKRLHRVGAGAENVFKRKTDRRGKNYNIVMAIDESGSMEGNNITEAALTAAFLADNFQHIKVDIAVLGFSSRTEMRKEFNETVAPEVVQKRILGNFMSGGTRDDEGLKHAYKLLNGRDGQNIVIMVGDGDGMPKEIIAPLIESHKNLAKTFAIGIHSDCPAYPQQIRVNDINELKPAVLNILKTQIQRG